MKENSVKVPYTANRRGAILLMAIGIIIFVLLLGLLFINVLTTDVKITVGDKNALVAFYIAEAGISYALPMLDEDSSWRTGVVMNFNSGSFTITLVDEGKGVVVIKSVGVYKSAQRTIKVKVRLGNWPNFKFNAERTAFNTPQHINSRELDEKWYFQAGDIIRSSPSIDKNKVVFGCNDGKVYCIKASDGTLVWSYTTGAQVISSPAIEGDQVFIGSDDGNFYCFDLNNGSLVWSYRNNLNPKPFQASPVVYNEVVYTASNDGNVYAFNIADGSLVPGWPFLIGNNVGIYSSPTIDTTNGVLYIGADNGNFYAINILTVSLALGWPYSTGAAIKSTACIANGYIYTASTNGRVYCFRPNGTYLWRTSASYGAIQSSPSYSPNENFIYIGAGNRRYYSFDANSGSEEDRYNTARPVDSTGAVQDDQVFVGNDDDFVVALNTWNLNRRFRYNCRGDVNTSPAIYGNNLYAGADSRRLYKFSSQVTPTGTMSIIQNSWRDTY